MKLNASNDAFRPRELLEDPFFPIPERCRVADWSKRKVQVVNVLLAVAFTVGVNVDSILIVRSLSNDSALRMALVAQAQELVKEKPAPPKGEQQAAEAKPALEELEKRIQKLTGLGVRVGWTAVAGEDFRQWPGWLPRNTETAFWAAMWWHTVRYHFPGWLLTALAASLGAPFWFDMLNKIITVRSTGRIPEERRKPQEEAPKP